MTDLLRDPGESSVLPVLIYDSLCNSVFCVTLYLPSMKILPYSYFPSFFIGSHLPSTFVYLFGNNSSVSSYPVNLLLTTGFIP